MKLNDYYEKAMTTNKEASDNKRDRIKGASLFQTIKQWATTDIVLAQRRREQLQQYS